MAAVVFNGKSLAPDVVVDETWFSDSDFCEKSKVHQWLISNRILSPLKAIFISWHRRI
jgi:hypothetical protein